MRIGYAVTRGTILRVWLVSSKNKQIKEGVGLSSGSHACCYPVVAPIAIYNHGSQAHTSECESRCERLFRTTPLWWKGMVELRWVGMAASASRSHLAAQLGRCVSTRHWQTNGDMRVYIFSNTTYENSPLSFSDIHPLLLLLQGIVPYWSLANCSMPRPRPTSWAPTHAPPQTAAARACSRAA